MPVLYPSQHHGQLQGMRIKALPDVKAGQERANPGQTGNPPVAERHCSHVLTGLSTLMEAFDAP